VNADWWGPTWLAARRELDERLRAKSFWVVNAILVVAVAAAVVIPALVGHQRSVERVGLLGADTPALRHAAATAGRFTQSTVSVTPVSSLAAARASLRSGALTAVLLDGREVLVKQQQVGNQQGSADTFAATLAQVSGLQRLIEQLRPGTAAAISAGVALPVRSVEGKPRDLASRFTGLGVALLIYLVIVFYGIRITQTVGEEKASRVVEVLLATIRPTQLLTGKVIGHGTLAFMQMLAAGAAFVIAGVAVGSNALQGTAGGVALVGALWLVLGYGLYCSAFAAAGSLISRQSDAANASLPLLIPLVLAYALANGTLFGGASGFYHVLGFIPWTAPIAMPTLFAVGAAPAWQMIVSALICLLATAGTARLAGLVYQRAVMRTGARVRIRQVLGPGAR